MTVTILKTFLIVLATLSLTACDKKCKPKIEYVDREVEVYIPQKCVVPKTDCDFKRETSTEVVASLLECIVNLKEASKVCR